MKKKIKRNSKKPKWTKKETLMFWLSALVGLVSGLVSGATLAYIFSFGENPSIINLVGAIIFTLILIRLIFWIRKQIKKNLE